MHDDDDDDDGASILPGDAGGEYQTMDRGRYSASMYVGIAFLLDCGLLGLIPMLALHAAVPGTGAYLVGLGIGAILSYLVFRDRWRCIEAYASRACSGVVNLSLLYVPLVALVYANVRGIRKLRGG